MVSPNATLSCNLEKWWAYNASATGAPLVSDSSQQGLLLFLLKPAFEDYDLKAKEALETELGTKSISELQQMAANKYISEKTTLYQMATTTFYKRKKEGMGEAAGEVPTRKFSQGWSGWVNELTPEEVW